MQFITRLYQREAIPQQPTSSTLLLRDLWTEKEHTRFFTSTPVYQYLFCNQTHYLFLQNSLGSVVKYSHIIKKNILRRRKAHALSPLIFPLAPIQSSDASYLSGEEGRALRTKSYLSPELITMESTEKGRMACPSDAMTVIVCPSIENWENEKKKTRIIQLT